jgi:hypothetical protein
MNLSNLTSRVKNLINTRGGMDSVKEDAQELKDIAGRDESATEKTKDAVDAIRDPGAPGEDKPTAPSPPPPGS